MGARRIDRGRPLPGGGFAPRGAGLRRGRPAAEPDRTPGAKHASRREGHLLPIVGVVRGPGPRHEVRPAGQLWTRPRTSRPRSTGDPRAGRRRLGEPQRGHAWATARVTRQANWSLLFHVNLVSTQAPSLAREAGHVSGTCIRVISRLLASGVCDGDLLASCSGSDPVPARASTPFAPSAGGRNRTGTAGSSRVLIASKYATSALSCVSRFSNNTCSLRDGRRPGRVTCARDVGRYLARDWASWLGRRGHQNRLTSHRPESAPLGRDHSSSRSALKAPTA